MDNKINKEEAIEKIIISKENQKYLNRICNNTSLKAEIKLEILKEHLEMDEETLSQLIEEQGVNIQTSQFAKAKIHTLKSKKRYLISSAQTASPVNKQLLENMKVYANFIDAEIGIIATRYKNPTSIWKEQGDVWDLVCHPYLTAKRQHLHKNLILLSDLKIQATSLNPTSGVESFGGSASVIVGSPVVEMKSVATLENQSQKFIYSTGSITAPSFTDTVAGGKASEFHSYGFIVVEIENDDVVHIRNVEALEDGSFNDLVYRVENGGINTEDTEVLTWGDSHFAQKDENVTKAFRKLCKDLKITTSILHDVYDSESLNIHNLKNPIVQHKLMQEGKDDLKKEIDTMFKELDWFEKNMKTTVVVSSNHDDMLDRAMIQSDWRDNLKNAKIFVNLLALKLSGKSENGLIQYHINNKYKKIEALGVNDSFIKYGVELGQHGHKGSNGSKGSQIQFSKYQINNTIGHGHCPTIKGKCYQVGISCRMDHGYNKGLSGWAFAGSTLNKHGKRQMIVFNKFTLTYTTLY